MLNKITVNCVKIIMASHVNYISKINKVLNCVDIIIY